MLELNESNFETETKNGLVLVDFFAAWCGPCNVLGPILNELVNAKVVKVNTDESQNLAVQHSVEALPTVILLNDGVEVSRFVGLQQRHVYQNAIDALTVLD